MQHDDKARWICIQSELAQRRLLRFAELRLIDVLALRPDGTVKLRPTRRGAQAAAGLCWRWGFYKEAKRIEQEFLR